MKKFNVHVISFFDCLDGELFFFFFQVKMTISAATPSDKELSDEELAKLPYSWVLETLEKTIPSYKKQKKIYEDDRNY